MRLARFKTYARSRFIKVMRDIDEDKETQKWVDLVTLKLLYSLMFFGVVEWVYVWWADNTLIVIMNQGPLIRSEQFTLSVLIHYPQYLLWGIIGGLFAVLLLNLLIGAWISLAQRLHRLVTVSECRPNPVKAEVPHA